MLKLKLQYFGHLMWRVDSLEKTPMLGDLQVLNVNITIHTMEQLILSFQILIQLIQTTLDTTYYAF